MKTVFSFLALFTIFSLVAGENPKIPEKRFGKVSAIILEDGSIIRAQDIDGVYLHDEENEASDEWKSSPLDDIVREYIQNGAGSGGIVEKGSVRPSYPAGSGGFFGDIIIEYGRSGAGSGGQR